jgi:transposase
MIALTAKTRVLCLIEPVDFRKGIDGLAALVREKLQEDPFEGTLFLFRNRRAKAVKLLLYDGQGFWLCMKRLSEGKFRYWPKSQVENGQRAELLARELSVLLWNGDPTRAVMGEDWKKLSA